MSLADVDPICTVIGRTRHHMLLAEVKEAARLGVGLIELRLDFLKKAPDLKRLLADKPCPMIATVRRPGDGGKFDGGEDARRTLLRQCIVGGFDWVDLETDVADAIPRFGPARRIVSYHNFREFPQDIEKIHERLCSQDADIVKIAVRAQNPGDNLRVLSLIKGAKKPTVAFCMGDVGFPSRILQARYGAPFTYACYNKERNIAPGMPSLLEIRRIYRYDRIDLKTRVFGVIGDPVSHSLGPLIHNAAFRALGVNAVYLPFRVPRDLFSDAMNALGGVPVDGWSVTIPHKEAAAKHAIQSDETVHKTRAANTLVRREGGFSAFNTDYQGFLDTLREVLPEFAPSTAPPAEGSIPAIPPAFAEIGGLAKRVVLVLGAGGVARAVAHALHSQGALVTVANRTSDRGGDLADEVEGRHVEWSARHSVVCDLVVNCTSVGMHPNVDDSPLHPSFLRPGLIVFDTVYTPEQTLLVKQARERGCHVITGVELFVRQAALQFEYFLGERAPIDLFRKVVRRALSPVALRDEEEP
ncbi:MAG: type I 3-dehydroquinate dehydratase [Gemmataceae bacterium]|nr:type I 3-dehydroquinate dehydratase [Gemmataceae bacterium]